MSTIPEIHLPNKSLIIFDDCPRGFEDELVRLMDEYARAAVIADRAARAAEAKGVTNGEL